MSVQTDGVITPLLELFIAAMNPRLVSNKSFIANIDMENDIGFYHKY